MIRFVLPLLLLCPAVSSERRCFESNTELRQAILQYDSKYNSSVSSVYGHPINSWCVTPVSDFSGIFHCVHSFNEDVSSWDVSNAVSMRNLFNRAEAFNQDISQWEVSKVSDMYGIFDGAVSFSQDLSSWDTSSVVDLTRSFRRAKAFNANIGRWNVSKIRSLRATFQEATAFNQDLSQWDVSSVDTFRSAFRRAKSFHQDLCSWQDGIMPKYEVDLFNMFKYSGCSVPASPVVTPNQVGPLCHYCSSKPCNEDPHRECLAFRSNAELRSAVEAYTSDSSKENSVAYTYGFPIGVWDTSNVTDFSYVFYGKFWFDDNINTWNVSQAVSMMSMFQGAALLNQDLSSWQLGNLENTRNMFKGAASFNTDLSDWELPSLRYADGMFYGAESFNQDLCAWGEYFPSSCTLLFDELFYHTQCPERSSPSLNGQGPYCHLCSSTGRDPNMAFEPSVAPVPGTLEPTQEFTLFFEPTEEATLEPTPEFTSFIEPTEEATFEPTEEFTTFLEPTEENTFEPTQEFTAIVSMPKSGTSEPTEEFPYDLPVGSECDEQEDTVTYLWCLVMALSDELAEVMGWY